MAGDASPDESTADVDYRQVSFVALAALAVVFAALVAPGVVGHDRESGDGGPTGERSADGDAGEGSDAPVDLTDLLEWLNWAEESGGTEGSGEGEPACTIFLDDDPVPGATLTATIHAGDEPLVGARVWFDDRAVGTTDERGRVTGEVPYVEELAIRVEAADGRCETIEPTSPGLGTDLTESPDAAVYDPVTDDAATDGAVTGDPPSLVPAEVPTAVESPAAAGVGTAAIAVGSTAQPKEAAGTNATVEYDVDGEVDLAVRGRPDPGARVTVEASIDDVPMGEAEVAVDGDPVAETDANGTATVSIPDDGTDRVDVRVARGDFAGSTVVDVRVLEATLAPEGLAPVPGSDGLVVAERADEPVADAAVAVDGDVRAATGVDGTAPIRLPLDPTAPVTVRTDDQTATVTLVGVYGGPVLALAVGFVGLAAASARTHGARGPVALAAVAAAGLIALLVEAFVGPVAGALALVGLLSVGIAGLIATADRRVARPSAQGATRRVDRLVGRVVAGVVAVVARLEGGLDRLLSALERIGPWIGSLGRSGTAATRRVLAWFARLPRRGAAGVRRAVAGVRDRPLRHLAWAVGASILVTAGYVLGGPLGAALALVALGVVRVVASRRRGASATREADTSAAESSAIAPSPVETRSVQETWRAFARSVAPGEWRTRAPAEIERRAIERGYPPGPVRELTALFREVEYGDRRISPTTSERARRAAAAVEAAREPADSHGEAADVHGTASGPHEGAAAGRTPSAASRHGGSDTHADGDDAGAGGSATDRDGQADSADERADPTGSAGDRP